MTVVLLALAIGVVAGLRAMTAPAMITWAAHFGVLDLGNTWLSFLATTPARLILTALALIEFVTDQLPSTPSRKVPVQFGARLVTGGISGAAIGAGNGMPLAGLCAGIAGAIIGTLAGASFRGSLAKKLGSDRPAALIEDVIAVGGAILIGVAL